MLIGQLRPTTLQGVKSLAAQLRKQRGVKHSLALDMAAQAANCSNFRNAQKILPVQGLNSDHNYVLLTIYWCDKDSRFEVGRETIRVNLDSPITELCSRKALKSLRGFGNLRMVADDHFVCDDIAQNQDIARSCLATAERSLRFMELSGLRPSGEWLKGYPNKSLDYAWPNRDHPTDWVDPATGQAIVIDEPYGGVNESARAAWAVRHNWRIAKTTWPGMYFPYRCDLFVVTDATTGYDVDALVDKINSMPAPFVAENWTGDSVSSWETFVSPMAKTPQDFRRARCRSTIYPSPSAQRCLTVITSDPRDVVRGGNWALKAITK